MKIVEQFFDEGSAERFLDNLHRSIYEGLSECIDSGTVDQISSVVLCLPFEKFNRLINIPSFREGYVYSKSLRGDFSNTIIRDVKIIGLSGDENLFRWKGNVFLETFDEDFQDKVFIVKSKTKLRVEEFTKTEG